LNRSTWIIAVVAAAVIVVWGGGLLLKGLRTAQLPGVEVNEYRGEKLGSILDFRENSRWGVPLVDAEAYRLKVTGAVAEEKRYTVAEAEAFPSYEKVVTLRCVEGWSVKVLFEGVRLMDLLEASGAAKDAKVVIFYAADGYTSSLTMDYIRDNDILLGFKMNGLTLPAERGFPFQVVAESKWGYKWVRWVTEIEVSFDEGYRGYWESHGYSNYGGLDESSVER
jgi:DMSO/TMAO reductase YedYZ molybdopterin-dependent catalytic subunit